MEVIVCNKCNGEGEVKDSVLDYHQNQYELVKCSKCNGTGRLITRCYRYFVSFDKNKEDIYATDSKIIELIRELEK